MKMILEREQNNKPTKLMLNFVLVFAFAFLIVLLVMSARHSITFDEAGDVVFVPQKFGVVLLRMITVFFVMMTLKRFRLTIGRRFFYIAGLVYILLNICLVFLLSLYPTYDQYYMTWIASDMIGGGTISLSPLDIWTCFRFNMVF